MLAIIPKDPTLRSNALPHEVVALCVSSVQVTKARRTPE
jgi:hypothetical protein